MADAEKNDTPPHPRHADLTGLAGAGAKIAPPSRLLLAMGFLVMLLTPIASYFLAGLSLPERNADRRDEQQQEHQYKAREQEQEREMEAAIFNMKPMMINIAETRGTRLLKLTPHLQFKEAGLALAPLHPLLADCISSVASGKTLDELDGPAGRDTLKKALIEQLNKLLERHGIAPVTDLYFEEFLIQ
jgi:flagellar basal body-associated protein FliL